MKHPLVAGLIFVQLVASSQIATAQVHLGRLSGVYRASKEGNEPGGPPEVSTSSGHYYLTFFPDGRLKRGRPDEGLDGWDDAFWMDTDLRSGIAKKIWAWGNYRLSGEQGQIVFTTHESWNLSINGYPQTIQAHGRTYHLLDSGNGLKLEGLYKAVKGDTSVTFRSNGTVNEEGIVLNCAGSSGPHFSYSGAVPSISPGQRFCLNKPMEGRYRVANYTLQFKFADGTSPSFVFWAEPSSSQKGARTLYINDVGYELAQ